MTRLRLSLFAALFSVFVSAPLHAADTSGEFLKALQREGYGELAIAHLEQLKATGTLPKELEETWDLEMSISLRLAAAEAYNRKEEADRRAQAQVHLDRFLAANPNHSAAAEGQLQAGNGFYDSALENIRQAENEKDEKAKTKLLEEARKLLEQSKPYFDKAVGLYGGQQEVARKSLDGTEEQRTGSTTRRRKAQQAADDAFGAWTEARMKRYSVDYYVALTYPESDKSKREPLLKKAAADFDSIYQAHRNEGLLVAFYAHLWEGRCHEAAGNVDLARDIYEEVLAIAPDDGRQASTGLEPLFAQVNFSVLMLTKKKQGADAFIEAAEDFLASNRTWSKLDGYQGVALELARVSIEQAGNASGDQKAKHTSRARKLLELAAKTRTSHQQEAILLLRQVAGKKNDGPPANADEAIARAIEAATIEDWADTVRLLEQGREQAKKVGQKATIDRAEDLLDKARHRLTLDLFQKRRFAEVIELASTMSKDRPTSENVAKASALAASAALTLYAAAPDAEKPKALERLNQIAEFIQSKWPDRAEADDARMALGQANLVRGEWAEAVQVFEKVSDRSLRYPTSLYLAGQTHFRLYTLEKRKPEGDRNQEEMTKELGLAKQQLSKSLELQAKSAESDAGSSSGLFEIQLLLAEVLLESGDAQQALTYVAPRLAELKKTKPEQIDNTVLRTVVTALRANLSIKNAAGAGELATLLAEAAPEHPFNLQIAKLIAQARRQSLSEPTEGTGQGAEPMAKGAAFADGLRQELAKIFDRLAKNEKLPLADMIFVADGVAELGNSDAAEAVYSRILSQADSAKIDKRALTRIRARQVELKVAKQDFKNGLEEAEKLVAANPNALEPLMARAKLVHAQAKVEPSAEHYEKATQQWTSLFNRLLKSKLPQLYDVGYGLAETLHDYSQFLLLEKDKAEFGGKTAEVEHLTKQIKQRQEEAETVLSALLAQSPKLNGTEMVAKYRQLREQVKQASVRQTTQPKAEVKPADQAAK